MMRIPIWARSIRFRLALLHSIVLFGLAVLVVGTINVVIARTLAGGPVTDDLQVRRVTAESGAAIFVDESAVGILERLANEQAVNQLRTTSLVSLAVLFPLSVLAGWIIAGRMLRPVGHITAVAREIQASDLSRRIRLGGPPDELRGLADTFDDMLERVEQGVEEQRQFIQDTSHELRNPLATMAMSLDVALTDPADHHGLEEAAVQVRRTLDRTALTVNELTRFARREIPEPGHIGPIDLGDLTEAVVGEFRRSAGSRRIGVEHVGGAGPVIRGDRTALHAALGNLIGNSVRLAPEGSTVRCGAGVVDSWSWTGVADEGPGIPAESHRLVFQRRWRKGVEGTAGEGEGIGLSIVRQVAESAGGTVTLTSAEGTGSSFVIWIPGSEGADPDDISVDGIHPVFDPLMS